MKMAIVSGSENLKKGEEEERGGMLAIRKHPRRMNEIAMTMNRVEVYRRFTVKNINRSTDKHAKDEPAGRMYT